MAKVNGFHLTPDGPKPCTASKGRCPYGEHYTTLTNAAIAHRNNEKLQEREVVRQELEAKAGKYRGPEVLSLGSQTDIFLHEDSGRRFDKLLRNHKASQGMAPDMIYVNSTFTLAGPQGRDGYTFRVKRVPRIDRDILKMRGEWSVEWWKTSDWSSDPAKDVRIMKGQRTGKPYHKHVFNLSNEVEANSSEWDYFEKLKSTIGQHEAFKEGAQQRGNKSHEQIMKDREDRVLYFSWRVTNVMRSVENVSMGPYQAARHGIGYFEIPEGYDAPLDINTRYSDNAFSGQTMLDLAQDTEALDSKLDMTRADARVKVWDRDTPDGLDWAVEHSPGKGWSVRLGNRQMAVQDAKGAYQALYGLYRERYGAEFAEVRKRRELGFTYELVGQTEEAFDRITAYRKRAELRNDDAREAQRQEFLRLEQEKNSGGFKKLLELFS